MVVFQLGKFSRKREKIEGIYNLENIVKQEKLINYYGRQSIIG